MELSRDESELIREEKDIENLKKRDDLASRIPEVLKRHFPQIFDKIQKDYNNLDMLITDLREAETRVHSFEREIKEHLARIKGMMPFLF
jgi:hypothetical protein